MWCKGGSAFEKEGEEGLAHFLEHMIFKGSSKLKEGEFDKKIESLGGSSNAATGLDDVHYYALIPPKHLFTAIDLLSNLVLTPLLNEKSYSLERNVVLEEIAQYKDQPEEQVFQALLENCFLNHPYGRSILGFEESLLSRTPEDMRLFHSRQYQPENMSIGIAGYIPKNIQEYLNENLLAKRTSNFCNNKSIKEQSSQLTFSSGRKEIEFPRLESARIMMAWSLPPAKDQSSLIGADIAASLLSEGRNSRLVKHLKEDLRIVESIDIDITSLELSGILILEAYCLEKDLERVEIEIRQVLKSCLTVPPTKKEMERAKELVRSSFCFGLELPSNIASISASQALWERQQPLLQPLKYLDTWKEVNIKKEIFAHIQPENSFTLIAKPSRSIN
ncbi:M16 family metallopeptidase [Prochlorococcus sp. MIT 0602]|uniref:M16 family metallopeptidase n=1 Tax=Prochlorococcus sp. MIT 0602 TaxID=1499499 RepID=UPI0039B42CFC